MRNPYQEIPDRNRIERFMPEISMWGAQRGLDYAWGQQLYAAYREPSDGKYFVGCFISGGDSFNPDWARRIGQYEADAFRREVHAQKAEDRFPVSRGSADGKRAIHYNFALRLLETAFLVMQITGNCTAASLRKLLTQLLGWLILLQGETWKIQRPYGTALVYGDRGHAGQGMSLDRAARCVMQKGTQWLMRYVTQENVYDLFDDGDDQRAGIAWGRSGPPADLVEITQEYPLMDAAPIAGDDPQWVKDFLGSGGLIHTGSTLTASSEGNPIAPLVSIGPHAQTLAMADDTEELRRYLRDVVRMRVSDADWFMGFHQTWGAWNRIANYPYQLWGPRPQGMWYVHWRDGMRIIRQTAYAYEPSLTAQQPDSIDWTKILAS